MSWLKICHFTRTWEPKRNQRRDDHWYICCDFMQTYFNPHYINAMFECSFWCFMTVEQWLKSLKISCKYCLNCDSSSGGDDLMIFKHTKDGAPAKFEGKPMSAPLRAYIKVKWSSFSRGLMIFRKILWCCWNSWWFSPDCRSCSHDKCD